MILIINPILVYFQRSLFIFTIFLILFPYFGKNACANSFSGTFVAVNYERLFVDTDVARQASISIQQEFANRQEEIKTIARAIVESAKVLDQQAPTLNQSEVLLRQNELRNRDLSLQNLNNKFNADVKRRNTEERERISQVIRGWLKKYSDQFNIDIFFSEAAYLNSKIDITENVIALMNGTKSLGSLTYEGPKVTSVAYIDPETVMRDSNLAKSYVKSITERFGPGESEEKNRQFQSARIDIANKANPIIQAFAQKNKIDIVLQNAAYLKPTTDITKSIIDILNGSNNYEVGYLPNTSTVAYVDSEKIFSSYPGISREAIAEKANAAIKNFSQKSSIDSVVQQAAYVKPAYDITNSILSLIVLPKEMNLIDKTINKLKSSESKIDEAKRKCSELGFKAGTDGFGKCVLRLSE